MPGWKEIRSIANVAQPRQPYMRSGATNGLMVLAPSCSALLGSRSPIARARSASRAARRSDRLRSFAGQTGRNPAFIVTSGTAIPLPKGIASPVTEFGLSRLTELVIGLEDKVGLIGSRCGLPREGRGRNQRDQRESSDERFHDASPRLRTIVHRSRNTGADGGYCWTYVIVSRFRLRGIAAKWSASIALRFDASSELGLTLRVVRRIVGLSAAVHRPSASALVSQAVFFKVFARATELVRDRHRVRRFLALGTFPLTLSAPTPGRSRHGTRPIPLPSELPG